MHITISLRLSYLQLYAVCDYEKVYKNENKEVIFRKNGVHLVEYLVNQEFYNVGRSQLFRR